MDDADLVARARQGDTAAFGELVDRHGAAVYRAALAAIGSHADAEEAAQDAFVAAYRRLASYRGESSFRTWLLAIAWRQAINRRRSRTAWWRRRAWPEEGDDDAMGNRAGCAPSPEDTAAANELRRAIRTEIRALPPRLRDALLLAQSGAYSYGEIGGMLDAPVGTVKWRVSEARRLLKERLRRRGYVDVG